jgi:ribokinase
MVVRTEKLPMPGETVMGTNFLMNPGGKGANQAVAAARLGSSVTLIARLGNDLFGKQSLDHFQSENIDTTFVKIDNEHPSGIALIGVDAKGENCIMVAPGSNGYLDVKSVEEAFKDIKEEAVILVQLEIPMETVEFVITQGNALGCKVILNPAPAMAIKNTMMQHLYMITPNESEAEALTGIRVTDNVTAERAAQKLIERGIRNVVITLGAKGAYLHSGSNGRLIPAPFVKAMDTTAAGDCFNGALAVALSEGQELSDAVGFACRAASISVTRLGAQSSMPTRREADDISLLSI